MHVPMKKAQVMMAWIGQKVVLSVQLDDGVLVYPVGAVGVLESVSPDGAVIVFDDDPTGDLVDVGLDDFMPLEFILEGYELKKVEIKRSPSFVS